MKERCLIRYGINNLKRPARRLRRQLRGDLYRTKAPAAWTSPAAVWVALLAARGYSLWQIGLAEGVSTTSSA